MEQFHEESISKIDNGLNSFLYTVFNILMYVFGLAAIFFLNLMLGGIRQGKLNLAATLIFFIFVLLAVGAYVLRNNQNIEYDYTFTAGVLDVARIINGTKRVRLLSADVRKFISVGPVSGKSYERLLKDPSIKKRYNYYLNKEKELYYVVFVHNEEKSLLVIEPGAEMLDIFRALNPNSFRERSDTFA